MPSCGIRSRPAKRRLRSSIGSRLMSSPFTALHAKLDELLRAHGEAKTELGRLDEKDVEEIEAHRFNARH